MTKRGKVVITGLSTSGRNNYVDDAKDNVAAALTDLKIRRKE